MKKLLLLIIVLFSCTTNHKKVVYEKPFVIIHKYHGTHKISYQYQDKNGEIINFAEYPDKREYFIGDTIK